MESEQIKQQLAQEQIRSSQIEKIKNSNDLELAELKMKLEAQVCVIPPSYSKRTSCFQACSEAKSKNLFPCIPPTSSSLPCLHSHF